MTTPKSMNLLSNIRELWFLESNRSVQNLTLLTDEKCHCIQVQSLCLGEREGGRE